MSFIVQLVNGDLISVSQSTVSRIIHRVSAQIASLIHEVIKMPSTEAAMITNRDLFRHLGAGREGIGLLGLNEGRLIEVPVYRFTWC
jgi:hypothetical protein